MKSNRTIFASLMEHLPRKIFDDLVNIHQGDKWTKSIKTWDVLMALLNGHLNNESSLRAVGLSHGSQFYLKNLEAKPIPRSTLSDACKTKKPAVFLGICQYLLEKIQGNKRIKQDAEQCLYLIDSTPIPLGGNGYEWATGHRRTVGLKLHIGYDLNLKTPVFFSITPPNVNDITEAKKIKIEAGIVYVFDRAYYDYAWWNSINEKNSIFVTRLKKAIPHEVITEYSVNEFSNVKNDQIIKLTTRDGKKYQGDLRKIRIELFNKKSIDIVSNDLTSSAEEIGELYRKRWGIEMFFKWIKQNLKIKRFWCQNENAVKLQILSGLIVYLLLKLVQMKTHCLYTLKQVRIIVRINLNRVVRLRDLFSRKGPLSYLTKPKEALLC